MQQTVIHPKIKKQGGYTLVELAIAVAILAVLIVAGLSGVQGILNSSKVNEQIKTVSKMSSKVNSLFSSTTTSGISTNNMRDLGAWDSAKHHQP
jgi:prepilin-type N-terminal cleavage/methylation domain-containing protein